MLDTGYSWMGPKDRKTLDYFNRKRTSPLNAPVRSATTDDFVEFRTPFPLGAFTEGRECGAENACQASRKCTDGGR